MSTTEELRRELEAEWMAQNTWLDYRNWLQSELIKSRQDKTAAYSQGYKDALTAAVEVCESFVKDISGVPEFRDQALAVQHRADVIKALPIPEAK